MYTINAGDRIYIIFDQRRRWIRTVQQDNDFHCDKGFLHFNDLIGQPYGQTFQIYPNSKKVAILKPLLSDIIFQMKRQSQIIYPEDIGTILFYSGIGPSSKILEAGTGSGTVSGILAHYCYPSGHVYSFDIRDNALNQARKNVLQMGMQDIVTIALGNILEDSMDFHDMDFVMLDLATPWEAVSKVLPYLDSQKGRLCLFSPTLEQVKKNVKALTEQNVPFIHTIEVMKRFYQVKPNATRPVGRMVGHTGFMTFGSLIQIDFKTQGYNALYSPENLGNLLVYAQLTSKSKGLIISEDASPLHSLLDPILHPMENITFITKKELSTKIDSLGDTVFELILVDNLDVATLLENLTNRLMNGGVLCGIHGSIEEAKELNLFMAGEHFYDISTSELIKREVIVDLKTNKTWSEISPNEGYITLGRKVADNIEFPHGKPDKSEKIEMLLDVGTELKDER